MPLTNIVARVEHKRKRFRMYRKAMGIWDAMLCFSDELLKREQTRRVKIDAVDVWIRTFTPDVDVAISSLHDNEYAHILAKDPATIIDAGANIGTSTVFFARKFPGARILAVEPEESNFKLLTKNVAPYPNVVPIKAAIWGVAEKRSISDRRTGHWGYTVSDTHNSTHSTGQEIDCVTMASLMADHGIEKLDILKMDIEGGEKSVLEHASEWIDRVDIMTIELHDRICAGCTDAFNTATKGLARFEKHGEKITAYRCDPGAARVQAGLRNR